VVYSSKPSTIAEEKFSLQQFTEVHFLESTRPNLD